MMTLTDIGLMLNDSLLEILVCPECKGELEYDRDNARLICHACRLKFAVEDDIPIMLAEEAEKF
jgi:uncharacterized protein YbaR (Trm112 family)